MHAFQWSFWSKTKSNRCLLSLNHLAGLCFLGKILQSGKSEGHISFWLKAGLLVDNLLWDPSFTTGTILNGKLGDLLSSGARTRSQELNYRPKLFYQLVRLQFNSSAGRSTLINEGQSGKLAWTWQGSLPTGGNVFPWGKWGPGENTFWFLQGWVLWTTFQAENGRGSGSLLQVCAHQMCSGVRAPGSHVAPYRKIIHYYQMLRLVIK